MTPHLRLAFAAVVLLSGCASSRSTDKSPALDGAAAARSVVLCETTLADLERRLGPPSRDGLLNAARIVTWVTDWDPLVRTLAVQVDARGRVTDLYWNLPSEISWAPSDRCAGR